MRRTPTLKLSTVLDNARDTRLSSLLREARRLQQLQQCLRDQLHPALGQQLRLLRADPGEVVIETDTSAWALRLRYQSRLITAILQREAGLATRRVVVKVVRYASAPPVAKSTRRCIPAHVAQSLRRTAQAVDDPALAQALQRLASHSRPES